MIASPLVLSRCAARGRESIAAQGVFRWSGVGASSRARREHAREHVEGGALARAVVAEQAEELVVLDAEVDLVHGRERETACSSKVGTPQLWGGLRRVPEATDGFQDAQAALRGA